MSVLRPLLRVTYSSYQKPMIRTTVPIKEFASSPGSDPGAGAGRGGGAGGAIRESGGGLGKYGAAQEEGYFHKLNQEKLRKFKKTARQEAEDEGEKAGDTSQKEDK